MHRKSGTPIPEFPLPEGYRFAMFNDGDEVHWARIEASVGEFDSDFAALVYFKEKYIPFADELRRRLVFVESDDGRKVATANAWWAVVPPLHSIKLPWRCNSQMSNNSTFENRRAWLHWVSTDPKHQGKGLGKAVTSHTLQLMRELEGDVDMYLSTQTWSYKAIDIYKKCGFVPTAEKVLYKHGGTKVSEYKKALKILNNMYKRGTPQ